MFFTSALKRARTRAASARAAAFFSSCDARCLFFPTSRISSSSAATAADNARIDSAAAQTSLFAETIAGGVAAAGSSPSAHVKRWPLGISSATCSRASPLLTEVVSATAASVCFRRAAILATTRLFSSRSLALVLPPSSRYPDQCVPALSLSSSAASSSSDSLERAEARAGEAPAVACFPRLWGSA